MVPDDVEVLEDDDCCWNGKKYGGMDFFLQSVRPQMSLLPLAHQELEQSELSEH